MLKYLRQHWRGNLSLTRAFWVNLVLLFILLGILERFLFPPYIENESAVTTAVIAYFIVVKLIVYPWQVVGVLRTCDLRIKSDTGRSWATAAQIALVVSLAVTLLATIETWQSLQLFKRDMLLREVSSPEPLYSLDLIEQETLIHLRGPFQIGITNRVADLIERYPEITGIILDSEGGQIYEGRGLARLIRDNNLQTFSLEQCLSSCTTAFVAGTTRTLGINARLGFHQYKTYSLIPSIDVVAEQSKDMAIFVEQGVSPEFLEKIFIHPPNSMWWPEIGELINAGVVHQTGYSPGNP
ncbi:MAG: hypothetical protein E2O60_05570 [Gammaproteobacteria bacterium]|nr:MAG: hypothetical protein E2O60_05570 [Gammaproteobacteria bacterium]